LAVFACMRGASNKPMWAAWSMNPIHIIIISSALAYKAQRA
jgi:hypothetical protein